MKTYVLKSTTPEPNPGNNHPEPTARLPKELEEELNPAQLESVNHTNGPLLVIAGAGSGKTKTLVYRVARLVHGGVAPEQILLLTFTRKSAQEMLHRASNTLDRRCQNVSGGTFHSFANTILRKYANEIGFETNFTITDRSDQEDIVKLVRKKIVPNTTDKRFPKKSTIANIFSKATNTQLSIERICGMDYPQFLEFAPILEEMFVEFTATKKRMQVMDYDDLLLKLRELLQKSEKVRNHLQNFYRYILVDEYQDTNAIQADIVKLLANDQKNVMVVGDDSQSIYSFRGANFKNIMRFPDLFPNAKIITLEENYRSKQPILDLTNAVISQATEKYSKNLFTQKKGTDKPVYVETDNENMQSKFVCQKILELREEGVELKDICALIRSGWHSNDLEIELKSHNIPFVKIGGFKFMETAHVKDVVSYIKVRHNHLDRIGWSRILSLIEGIGPKSANDIIDQIQKTFESGIDLSPFSKKKYYQDVQDCVQMVYANPKASPLEVLNKVMTFYRPIFKQKYDDFTKRQADLESIENVANRYEDIETFLSEVTLEPPDASQSDSGAEDQDNEHITISTIHSSKGLEWHTVFLLSAVDGYIPSFQSMGDMNQLEEERRLLYVALTRAKVNLFIIKPNLESQVSGYYRYTGMRFAKLSRFLDEGQLIRLYTEKWNLIQEEPKKPSGFNSYDNYQYRNTRSSYDNYDSSTKNYSL